MRAGLRACWPAPHGCQPPSLVCGDGGSSRRPLASLRPGLWHKIRKLCICVLTERGVLLTA